MFSYLLPIWSLSPRKVPLASFAQFLIGFLVCLLAICENFLHSMATELLLQLCCKYSFSKLLLSLNMIFLWCIFLFFSKKIYISFNCWKSAPLELWRDHLTKYLQEKTEIAVNIMKLFLSEKFHKYSQYSC